MNLLKTASFAAILVALLSTGCATKDFSSSYGLVFAVPASEAEAYAAAAAAGKTDHPLAGTRELFRTGAEALPGHPDVTGALSWRGVTFETGMVKRTRLSNWILKTPATGWRKMETVLETQSPTNRLFEYLFGPQGHALDAEPFLDLVLLGPSPDKAPAVPATASTAASGLKTGVVEDARSPAWPSGHGTMWYQGDGFTQIAAARDYARTLPAPACGIDPIRVFHIDTGIRPQHVACPTNIVWPDCANFYDNGGLLEGLKPDPTDVGLTGDPGEDFLAYVAKGHGCGTISVLAGPDIVLKHPDGSTETVTLGACPHLPVAAIRARPNFVHFFPVRLARAIMHAVDHKADVVSISQAGGPGLLLTAAVNEAYDRGAAIYAASSDFLSLPLGINLPHHKMLWPAAYDRVTPVPGVTASFRSYGDASAGGIGDICRFICDPGMWMIRGSYGPAERMTRAVCGFTPNSVWADGGRPDDNESIDLDGQGTSSTTPQVAGAAALWLQAHQTKVESNRYTWRKVELVNTALRGTASKKNLKPADVPEKFGCGYVQALDAIKTMPNAQSLKAAPADFYPSYPDIQQRAVDLFDGEWKRKHDGTPLNAGQREFVNLHVRSALNLLAVLKPEMARELSGSAVVGHRRVGGTAKAAAVAASPETVQRNERLARRALTFLEKGS